MQADHKNWMQSTTYSINLLKICFEAMKFEYLCTFGRRNIKVSPSNDVTHTLLLDFWTWVIWIDRLTALIPAQTCFNSSFKRIKVWCGPLGRVNIKSITPAGGARHIYLALEFPKYGRQLAHQLIHLTPSGNLFIIAQYRAQGLTTYLLFERPGNCVFHNFTAISP